MGDRIRIGELLAAIGTIGLAVTLVLVDWFSVELSIPDGVPGVVGGFGEATTDAGALGWFAFASLLVTLLAAVVFFLRALTGRGPERAMLQGPIAYTFAGFSFLVLLVRLFVFVPSPSPDSVSGEVLLSREQIAATSVDVSLLSGAYLGLLFVFLLVVGLWFALHDERSGSAASKAQTAALLADVPVRPVPHVPAPPESDASVVADDAVPTDPSRPSDPASGGPA